jgi:hypothetical protein
MRTNKNLASLKNLVIIIVGLLVFLLLLALLVIAERFLIGQV